MNLTTELQLSGTFWVSGTTKQVTGTVDLESEHPLLTLDAVLTHAFRLISKEEVPEGLGVGPGVFVPVDGDSVNPEQLTIHGVLADADSTSITLVDTMLVRRTTNLFGLPGKVKDVEIRSASHALIGAHLESSSTFDAARIQYWNTEGWFREVPAAEDDVAIDSPLLSVEAPSADAGARPAFVWTLDASSGASATLNSIWSEVVNPLRTILTIATDSPTPVFSLEIQSSGGQWVSVQHPQVTRVAKQAPLSRTLLNREHVPIEILRNWLNQYPRLSPVPALVASSVQDKDQAIELQVLELAAAAEGLHRRVGTNERYMTKLRARAVREVVKNALEDDIEAQRLVINALSQLGAATFADRLRDLLAMSEGTVAQLITPAGSEAWIVHVKNARNGFAHLLEGADLKLETQARALEYYVLKQTLRWLVGNVLLIHAGVPAIAISDRLQNHTRYSYLLRQAAEWLPQILAVPANNESDPGS